MIFHAMQAVRHQLVQAEGLCAQMSKNKSSSSQAKHKSSEGAQDGRSVSQLQGRLQQLAPVLVEESAKMKVLLGR